MNNKFAIFDGAQLTTVPGLTVLATNPYRAPRREVSIAALARIEKNKVNSALYRSKDVLVKVGISRVSRNFLEQSLDALWLLLHGKEKDLVIPQAGSVRKYICTLSDAQFTKDGGAYAEIDLIFSCSDPFGYETGYTTALNLSSITSATRNDVIPIGGSAPWQVPYIMVLYSAVSGGTSKTVSIGNSANGQQVRITRTWVAGDRIEIDSFEKTVKVNGLDVDFDGSIPEWKPALGNWEYTDDFDTSRTFSALIRYYKRYL